MPYKSREQKRKFQREWYANRRAAWFSNKSCVECGATEDLHLHHIDPSQKESHKIWSWSQERRDEETSKCEVRCASCHKAVHTLLNSSL